MKTDIKDNKKILIIGDCPTDHDFQKLGGTYKFGGISRSISNLVNSRDFKNNFEYELFNDNNNSHYLLGSVSHLILTLIKLAFRLRTEKFDKVLLYCNSINLAFAQKFLICLLVKLSSTDLYVRYGGSKAVSFFSLKYLQFVFKVFFSLQKGILVQGSTGLNFYSRFNCQNIFIYSNFVKNEFIIKEPVDKKINKVNVLVSTGTDYKRKGFLLVLKSIKDLDITKFNFLIVGCNNKVIGEIRQYSFKDNVKLFPDLSQIELSKIIDRSHILLHPSYSEGLPNLILESMAKGLFIVTTGVGSIPDLVKHRKNGYIVDKGSSSSIVKILNKIYRNKNIIFESSTENIALIRRKYSEKVVVPKMVNFLKYD